ncbi:LINE-1 retrotransposable element ORF2 protein [Cucumis melo var. makuwa]|uniref:LINE-1 retrotransposable element ORF2 protein n=1 Tax=Cucumis melo var. makuwa TaxID=1194695 RepID=A0A5A7T8V0_CUCMM|nr:LINE-1 retrotransposable element ORF2 protein [Cucumis melo var. makuwa]TYK00492.1 LINE-1 retrotransposable element ORF2 protein [Cucumis melo var. makuwa]
MGTTCKRIWHMKDGETCNIDATLEKVFIDHFTNIYAKIPSITWLIENLDWSPITSISGERLCDPFDEKEVSSILHSFENNKAPGSDGFTMEFLKHNWNHLNKDIMAIFSDFSKKERLKDTLPHMISEYQMTFVNGRQITDAILTANEGH